MTHILKNKNLEIHVDTPFRNYNSSRFDWTGKIVKAKFQHIQLTGLEKPYSQNENFFGKGFYNEFGIDTALGFDETEIGGWFHKIGVGLLKKDDTEYLFSKNYQLDPAEFKIIPEPNRLFISCKSKAVNGYSYLLRKEIELRESGFTINYNLENKGEKDIITSEYVHNFMAINKDLIGSNYILKFPFNLYPELFEEIVNPEHIVNLEGNEIKFNGSPKEQFFFSNLTGGEYVDAKWELINLESKIVVSETGSFHTNKVNLWGWKHVISPELFFEIFIKPGQSAEWSRNYDVYKIM